MVSLRILDLFLYSSLLVFDSLFISLASFSSLSKLILLKTLPVYGATLQDELSSDSSFVFDKFSATIFLQLTY